jgi:hypothetical protein
MACVGIRAFFMKVNHRKFCEVNVRSEKMVIYIGVLFKCITTLHIHILHILYTLKKIMARIQIVTISLLSMYKSLIDKMITDAENSGKTMQRD